MRPRRVALVVLSLAAVGVASACGGGDDDAGGGATIVDAEDQAPAILNVLLAEGAGSTGQRVVSNIQQNLLTADAEGRYVPQLAESVPSGEDLRTGPLRVTFRLRPGARWSDGVQVTAADAVFTWRTMTAARNQVASRTGWSEIAAVTPGRTATGGACPPDTCFTVRFTGDYAPWRDVFSVAGGYYLLPRHALRGKDFNTAWNRGGVVGSGPYVLDRFQPGVRAVLRRDPRWWGAGDVDGTPVDRLVFNFLDSPGGTLTALDSGEADMVNLVPDPDLIERARDIDGVTVDSVPSVYWEHLALNADDPLLRDPVVRRALAYAIDRQEVVDRLLGDDTEVLQSQLRPFMEGYTPVFERYGYDPGRAADLLEGDGWTRGDDGIFVRDGRALELPVIAQAGNELRRRTVRLLAVQAARAGIRLRYVPQSPPRLFGASLPQGDFSIALVAFGGSPDPSPTPLLGGDQIPSAANGFTGQNYYRWRNPAAQRLMARSDRTVDPEARAALLGRVQEAIAEDVPLIPLYQQPNTVAHTDRLQGVVANPTQVDTFWNSGTWTVEGAGGG